MPAELAKWNLILWFLSRLICFNNSRNFSLCNWALLWGSKEFSSSAQFDINQPLFVFAQPEEEDPKKIRIQLMPYAQLSDNQCVHINFKNVVWSSDPETGLKNQYQTL